MTKDDIIHMALECDLLDSRDDLDQPAFAEIIASVERFYHLVAAAEREVCAKVCEDAPEPDGADLAERIRARSQS